MGKGQGVGMGIGAGTGASPRQLRLPVLHHSHAGILAEAVVFCLLPGWCWDGKALSVLVSTLQLLGQQVGMP